MISGFIAGNCRSDGAPRWCARRGRTMTGMSSDAPTPPVGRSADRGPTTPTSALPSVTARVLAFLAIVIGGVAGGFIGYAFVDLQVTGDDSLWVGLGALFGAVAAAIGTAVVVVLTLRAMGEWRTIQERDEARAAAARAHAGVRRVPRVR